MMAATTASTVTTTSAARLAAFVRGLHGRPVEGVPRGIVLAAYAAALTALPSCVWRLALCFGAPIGPLDAAAGDAKGDLPSWVPMWGYAIFLCVVSEGLAFLTVGLVSQWGEVMPRWIPFLGGRRVPTRAAVIPASLGAAALTLATLLGASSFNEFKGPDGISVHLSGWKLALFVASYGPLLAWGPLLAITTAAYYLRRTRQRRSSA